MTWGAANTRVDRLSSSVASAHRPLAPGERKQAFAPMTQGVSSSPACSREREGTSCQVFFGFFGTGASMIIQGLLNVLGNRGRDDDDAPDAAPDAAPPPARRSLLIVAADVHFKIKRHTKMRKVFYAYAARKGVAVDSLRFLFKGSRVRGDQTASEIGMANGDQLDVENHPMIYHADIHGCTGPGFRQLGPGRLQRPCAKTTARASTTPSSARDTYIQRVPARRMICVAVAPSPRHM